MVRSDDNMWAKLQASDPKSDPLITNLADGDLNGFELLRQMHQKISEELKRA